MNDNDLEVLEVCRNNGIPRNTKIRMGNVVVTWMLRDGKLKELSRSKPGCRIYSRSQMDIPSGLYQSGVQTAYAILRGR